LFPSLCNNWPLKIYADFRFCCFCQTWIWCTHILCQLFLHCHHKHHCVVSSLLFLSLCFSKPCFILYMENYLCFCLDFCFPVQLPFFILLLWISLGNLYAQIWCGIRKRNEARQWVFGSVVAVAFQSVFHLKIHQNNNFYYFLRIIFDINISKWSKNTKKY